LGEGGKKKEKQEADNKPFKREKPRQKKIAYARQSPGVESKGLEKKGKRVEATRFGVVTCRQSNQGSVNHTKKTRETGGRKSPENRSKTFGTSDAARPKLTKRAASSEQWAIFSLKKKMEKVGRKGNGRELDEKNRFFRGGTKTTHIVSTAES